MRKLFLLIGAVLLSAAPVVAQRTVVSGTVKDVNGLAYSSGSLTVTLSTPVGTSGAYLNGAQVQSVVGPVLLDSTGSFLVSLADNTLIQCANAQGQLVACAPQTKWSFAVTLSPGVPPPTGTGPQTCPAGGGGTALTISGASQSVSASFSACPAVSIVTSSGGLSGMTPGQVPIAATATTVTSSVPATTTVNSQSCPLGSGSCTISATTPSVPALYTLFQSSTSNCLTPVVNGATVCAINATTGAYDFSGSDAAVVINSILTANATVGGRIYFKNGVYPLNSVTSETATGCSTFTSDSKPLQFVIGFPSNTPYQNGVQWIFEGVSSPIWAGELGAGTSSVTGAILNVTSTAIASATAGAFIAGLWNRPVTNCNFAASNSSNDIFVFNLDLRFPTNQRGNECAFCLWMAGDVKYDNVIADFALAYNTIATGSAPVKGTYGSFGLTSTVSSAGNTQYFQNTYGVGYDINFDFTSEHIVGGNITSIFSNFACEFGRSTPTSNIFHPSSIQHFVDQENGAGCIWGPGVLIGTEYDIGYDLELGNDANWYSTARNLRGLLTDVNGTAGGMMMYNVVKAGSGIVVETPPQALFASGGAGFLFHEGTGLTNVYQTSGSDNFTRPNQTTLGGGWDIWGAANSMIISSNAATQPNPAGAGNLFQQGGTPADQFSKAVIGTIGGNTSLLDVLTRAASGNVSLNAYNLECTAGATAPPTLGKWVAGVHSNLSTGAVNCAAGDTLELRSIGTSQLGIHTHAGVADYIPTTGIPVTDASVTSGFPGIYLQNTVSTMTSWSGGGFPQFTSATSQAANPMYASVYNTNANCTSSAAPAVCGAASEGAVVIAAAASTVTINTSAVTPTSNIHLNADDTLGTRLGVTCNSTIATLVGGLAVTARSVGVSFQVTSGVTPAVNPLCFTYRLTN